MAKAMTLKAILALDAKQFNAAIKGVQSQIASIGNYMKGAFAIGSAAMFGKTLVEFTKNYEDAMARVKAVSNASQSQMKMMNDEALRLGATTRYTATQVAETLEVLTRNGFSAEKATKSLAATLQLAQSQAINLADAGNMLTNTLNMFGLSVKDVQRVNDVLASIASNTATNVQDLYDALVNAAPMAHALGISIEETAAALGSLAQRGIKGADAGTQLRMALQKLVDPAAMKKMEKLGIHIDENRIAAEGFQSVLQELANANLSVSQLNEIFTVRSSKAVLQLVNAVDDFNAILEITKNSSGTAMRMFEEGVGSVRKELDILRSVWENFIINIGTKSSGPIKGVMKTLQNFITSIQTKMGFLTNIGAGIAIALTSRLKHITTFFSTLSNLRKKDFYEQELADAERAKSYLLQDALDAKEEKRLANKILRSKKATAEQKKAAQLSIEVAEAEIAMSKASVEVKDKEIAGIQREIAAINTLKATLKSLAISAIWIAAVTAITAFINHLIAANKALKDAKDRLKEVGKENQNLISKVELLKDMIGNGEDKDSLAAAVAEATRTFSEFSQEIKKAYIEAGKTGSYKKLKKLLEDIANLQNTIRAQQANQSLLDAQRDKYAEYLSNMSGPIARRIRGGLETQGYTTKEAQNAFYQQLADIFINNRKSTDKGFKAVTDYIDRLGIKLDYKNDEDKIIKWFEKATSDVVTKGLYIKYKTDSPYLLAANANDRQQELTEQANTEERNIKINSAFDAYNMEVGEAAKNFSYKSKEYKEAMEDAASNLKEAIGDMYNDMDWSKRAEYDEIQQKWGGKQRSQRTALDDSGSSSSKGKTEWDKFTEELNDYNKQMTALKSQLKNGAISQEEYDHSILKLRKDTWLLIAGMDELDEKMKNLSQTQKDAVNEVQTTFPKEGAAGDSLVEMAKLLKDYNDKRDSIKQTKELGGYDSLDDYLEALTDLENETWKNISSLKSLNEAVKWLPDSFKKIYEKLLKSIDVNKNLKTETQKIELEGIAPNPSFTAKDTDDYDKKLVEYNKIKDLIENYLKNKLKLDSEYSKGNIDLTEYEKQMDKLNNEVYLSMYAFRNLDTVIGALPPSFKKAATDLRNSMPKTIDDLVNKERLVGTLEQYSMKASKLLEQKMSGEITDEEYQKELKNLVTETTETVNGINSVNTILDKIPTVMGNIYKELMALYNEITGKSNDDNEDETNNPKPQEAAPTVEKPIVAVDVDEEKIGKAVNVEVNVESPKVESSDETTNNGDIISQLEELNNNIQKNLKGEQQYNDDKLVEDAELDLHINLENIDNINSELNDLKEQLNSGTYDGPKEAVLAKIAELTKELQKACDASDNLELKLKLANGISQLNSQIEDFKSSAFDNISSVASAFDRLLDGIESIYSAFGEEIELEGLKKVMSVINGIIQTIEAVKTVIEIVKAAEDAATKKKLVNSGKEVVANLAVASSEGVKAGAAASAAAAEGAESVAGVPIAGPALAVAAVASIVAALVAAFASLQKFSNGGIVAGSTSGDKNLVRTNGKEMILTRAQQGNLYRMIAEGGGRGGQVEFKIRGDELVGVLKNHNRKWN